MTPIWKAFASVDIQEVGDEGAMWTGHQANPNALPLLMPVYVVSAANPRGMRASDGYNDSVHSLLETAVRDTLPRAQVMQVVSYSPDGQWREQGLALSGISKAEALVLVRQFYQLAMFALTRKWKMVVNIEGGVEAIVPRLGTGWKA
jgi:hypothetical protein